uniref:WD repeat-containing protein 11 n=1 Tax=Amazona collaria TaxID=241587 RepID=A0A8B9FEB8_9PSIT
MQRFTVNIKLPARTLTGALSAPNRGAADWGWQGLIAYGCHSLVLVVDANTAQTLQVLERHKASVVKVKWAKENYHHNIGSPYSLRLASADVTGKIIVWDVATGTARCEIQEHAKPIQDMQWLWNQDASRDLLLAVHPPNYIVLWNADTGTKLWKKSYAENILSFSFDPFDPSHLALLTSEGIVFISDFSPSKAPASSGKKVYISSPHSSPSHNKLAAATGAKKALDKVKILISNEKPSAESVTLNDCLQLSYLPSKRNYMLLLYPREILILDLEVNQTVGVIAIERTGVPFLQVIPCFQRDGLFCLHENGCITLRVRRSNCSITGTPNEEPDPDPVQELIYDLRSQCDAIRVTKTVRPFSMVCCPVNENSAALIVSDGRVMIWELKSSVAGRNVRNSSSSASPLYSPVSFCGIPVGAFQNKLPDLSLDSMIGQSTIAGEEQLKSPFLQEVHLKFLLTGLLSGLPLPPFAIRMCPPLTTKNIKQYEPILAVGTSNGSVLVFHLTSGLLHKELSIHSCEVKGIEWISLTGFISFATSTPNNLGLVRNELQLVDLPTGRSTAFRGERGNDEPAIEMIKVSHLKQYLAVVFKDKPLEIWDVRTCTLLREMSKNFPIATALEWSPSHNLKSLRKKQLAAREAMARQTVASDTEVSSIESSVISLLQEAESKSELSQNISAREHFVFTGADGQVYHLTVEGNSVKDSARIPPDGSMGSITCIAWKGDTLVLGDVDGNLNFWDLKARVSRCWSVVQHYIHDGVLNVILLRIMLWSKLHFCFSCQTDRAVQLLLETSSENAHYYCDSLKACLVTTVTSSGPSQSTIKLVATNMIANGKLAEGVQLLCLIDKAADACRYLQTYGEWNRAAWLAKVRLNSEECADVLKRWVDHLCSPQVNQKSKAILVLLSLGCFTKVAEMLHSMRYFDRAALFVEACLEYGAFEVNDDTNILFLKFYYARSLKLLGFKQGALLFGSKAGESGKELLTELKQPKEEVTQE